MKNNVNKSVGKIGVSKVSIVVNSANCLFNKIELENDIGNDAFIEFVSGDESTSFCIACQIKSGNSFISGEEIFIPTDKKHLAYWNAMNLPVAGFVYIPQKDIIYWVDIKEYIRENKTIIDNGPYKIVLSKNNVFCDDTFHDFYDHFIQYGDQMRSLESFLIALRNFSEFNDVEAQYIGLKNIFTYHRDDFFSWFTLINYFKYCKNESLIHMLIEILTLIPGHGDIWWHKGNVINGEIRSKASKWLKSSWGGGEIRKLLKCINEDAPVERGSLGESIHAIINHIENSIDLLKIIAFDKETEDDVSYNAFIMYLYDLQFNSTIDEVNVEIEAYLTLHKESPYFDMIKEVKCVINEFGSFDIY